MKFKTIFFTAALFCSFLSQAQNKNKIEDLLIWKISEDLKLTVPEEKKLSEIIKDISAKKQQASAKIEELVQQIPKLTSDAEKLKALTEYKKQMKTVSSLMVQEIEQIQKALGVDRASKYIVAKNEVASRIRSLLTTQERAENKVVEVKDAKLPEPKVIEE
jgi:hypothetical protein